MNAFDFMSQILDAGRARNLLDFGRKKWPMVLVILI
jgi:hypothetical protein